MESLWESKLPKLAASIDFQYCVAKPAARNGGTTLCWCVFYSGWSPA